MWFASAKDRNEQPAARTSDGRINLIYDAGLDYAGKKINKMYSIANKMASEMGAFRSTERRARSILTGDWQLSVSPTSYRTTSLMKTATAFSMKDTKRWMWM